MADALPDAVGLGCTNSSRKSTLVGLRQASAWIHATGNTVTIAPPSPDHDRSVQLDFTADGVQNSAQSRNFELFGTWTIALQRAGDRFPTARAPLGAHHSLYPPGYKGFANQHKRHAQGRSPHGREQALIGRARLDT